MARKRDLLPDRWTKEDNLALSWGADHFLVGLTNFTDDAGRVQWSARQLWSRVSPRPDVSIEQVEGWMAEIVGAGLYTAYEVGGKVYAQAGDWWQEQYIAKPQPSKLPVPEAVDDRIGAQHSEPVRNDPHHSSLARVPVSVSVTDSVTVPVPVASAREAAPDPFAEEIRNPQPLTEWQQAYAEAARGLSPPRSDFEIAAHLGEVEAIANEAVGGGVEPDVVREAISLLAAKAKGVPRRLDIEISEVRQSRAGPPQHPLDAAEDRLRSALHESFGGGPLGALA